MIRPMKALRQRIRNSLDSASGWRVNGRLETLHLPLAPSLSAAARWVPSIDGGKRIPLAAYNWTDTLLEAANDVRVIGLRRTRREP